jgi:FlgD Ig-like domain
MAPVVFPNPVQGPGPATLQFNLPNPASQVQVKLFTTAFRRVRETSLGAEPAGFFQVPLTLRDDRGTPLANGLYYVVVSTPRGFSVARLLILR